MIDQRFSLHVETTDSISRMNDHGPAVIDESLPLRRPFRDGELDIHENAKLRTLVDAMDAGTIAGFAAIEVTEVDGFE